MYERMNQAIAQIEIEQDEPGDYFRADFIGPCVWGDIIEVGDTVRRTVKHGSKWELEHRECADERGPVFD